MEHEWKVKLPRGVEGGSTTRRPGRAAHPQAQCFQEHSPFPAGEWKGVCVQQDPVANRSCFSSVYVVYSKIGFINLEKKRLKLIFIMLYDLES